MKKDNLRRLQQIARGKLWQVYLDGDPDKILCEGSKTACRQYIRNWFSAREFKKGYVRLGQLIHETADKEPVENKLTKPLTHRSVNVSLETCNK